MWRFTLFLVASILASAPAHARDRGVVIGYVAAFKGLEREMQQRGIEQYTHLDLAFVNPTPAGEVVRSGGLACAPAAPDNVTMVSGSQLQSLVASAHERGAKVLASVGGALIPPCGGDWTQLLAAPMRATVAANLIAMVDRYDLDGLDVDLEGELMTSIDKAGNYTPFVQALAEALHARSKILTAATGSYPGGMVPDASLPFFDLIGVMSYDQVGPKWGTPGDEHSTYAQAEADLTLWIGKGVPASKLALGMPFYGRGFGTFREGWSLADIKSHFGQRQLSSDVAGQRCGGCSYITYNGLPTLERKAELAGAWGAGVMVWEVGQDLQDGRVIRSVVRAYEKGRSNARKH
ncbi:glycosyl hydrolase family 18 protein [Sphingomonas segetis]|jgi:GH18 family chitinase|uniref:glycosyl hydrolase family 18 protein n=1 Tax=Sphingomonas segetis TaxID=1104779 RepID=UPI0012D304E8|nr:glycosyl hydrolase family 18 protein [Sphingomonas segetis]